MAKAMARWWQVNNACALAIDNLIHLSVDNRLNRSCVRVCVSSGVCHLSIDSPMKCGTVMFTRSL